MVNLVPVLPVLTWFRFSPSGFRFSPSDNESWTAPGVYPIATLQGSALGGSRAPIGTLALAADGERLILVKPDGRTRPAGPTFGELLRYLALGWKQRSEAEEDIIGALMLRARLRSSAAV